MAKVKISKWAEWIVSMAPASNSPGIGIRTFIERLHGLGDYASFDKAIKELIAWGYLKQDKQTLLVRQAKPKKHHPSKGDFEANGKEIIGPYD